MAPVRIFFIPAILTSPTTQPEPDLHTISFNDRPHDDLPTDYFFSITEEVALRYV